MKHFISFAIAGCIKNWLHWNLLSRPTGE